MEENRSLGVFEALRYFRGFYNGMESRFVLFYFGRLITMLQEIIVPILVGILINLAVYGGTESKSLFLQISGVMFGICLFGCMAYYLVYELYSDFWNTIVERIRKKTFAIALHMDAEEMSASNYGDMAQQVQWQIAECVQLIVKNIIHNVNNFLHIFICLFLLFRMNILLGVTALLLMPISAIISWKGSGMVRNERAKNQNKYAEYINWVYEVTANYKDIRLMKSERYVKEKFLEHQNVLIETDIKSGIASLIAQNSVKLFDVIIQMILYILVAVFALKNGMTVGSVTVAVSYYIAMKGSAMTLVGDYFAIQNRLVVITRISKLLEKPIEQDDEKAESIDFDTCEIEFDNVTFGYKGKEPIVKDLSFHLRKGEKLALVGESGCGKSTIAYLILGFYKPQNGTIKINGRDIREYSISSLRKNIGMVQQEVWIFDGTVRDNLLLGKKDIGDDELISALIAASAYDFINEMEQGLSTILGKNSRQLSGGQKQRIGIARVYLKKPALLLFDEATSALDAHTEELVHTNMMSELQERSAIVIAHRKSAVMLCDRVLMMKDGRIIQTGTPNEMERDSEDFRSLFAIK